MQGRKKLSRGRIYDGRIYDVGLSLQWTTSIERKQLFPYNLKENSWDVLVWFRFEFELLSLSMGELCSDGQGLSHIATLDTKGWVIST